MAGGGYRRNQRRLVFRHATEDDHAFIFALVNDPGWLRFISDKGVKTEADARAYIRKSLLSLYERFGFVVKRRLPEYYGRHRAGVKMVFDLGRGDGGRVRPPYSFLSVPPCLRVESAFRTLCPPLPRKPPGARAAFPPSLSGRVYCGCAAPC